MWRQLQFITRILTILRFLEFAHLIFDAFSLKSKLQVEVLALSPKDCCQCSQMRTADSSPDECWTWPAESWSWSQIEINCLIELLLKWSSGLGTCVHSCLQHTRIYFLATALTEIKFEKRNKIILLPQTIIQAFLSGIFQCHIDTQLWLYMS